jgi:glycosyltransferase involved in cell wall biosynthesis
MEASPSSFDSMHSDSPLVSIILPVKNGAKYIAEAIESCLQQTYNNIELLVVDDGSSDQTIDIVRGFGIEPIINQGRPGANAARNLGLKSARGVFVKFLDADDMLMPRAIEYQVEFAKSLKEIQVGFGSILDFGLTSSDGFYRVGGDELSSPLKVFSRCFNGIQTSLPLHRRDFLNMVGGFDERLRVGQEWNLHVRLAVAGVEFISTDIPVCLYRSHPSPWRIGNVFGMNSQQAEERLVSVSVTWQYFNKHCPGSLNLDVYEELLVSLFYIAKANKKYSLAEGIVRELLSNQLPRMNSRWSRKFKVLCGIVGCENVFRINLTVSKAIYFSSRLFDNKLTFDNLIPGRKK